MVEGHSITYLLYLRSPIRSKTKLYKNRENCIRRACLIKKVKTLLSSARDHSVVFATTRRCFQQQRSLQKSREMGNRIIPICNQLCAKNSSQIPSISRLCGRLDTFSTSKPTASNPNLDALHRRSMGAFGSGGLHRFGSTIRPLYKVCSKTRIQNNK